MQRLSLAVQERLQFCVDVGLLTGQGGLGVRMSQGCQLPGQSRIFNPVLGVPGGGYNVPDFRSLKFAKKNREKMSEKLLKLTFHIPDLSNFPGGVTHKPPAHN